jgi:hypothetical protein
MVWRKMGIAQGHRDGLVSYQFLDGPNIYPSHDQARGEGVSEVMKVEVLKLRSPAGILEGIV